MSISIRDENAERERTANRRRTIWFVVSVLFTLGNLAGGIWAARNGELVHAGVHTLLLYIGAKVAWRLAPRRFVPPTVGERSELADSFAELRDRLQRIEHSVESVAIEVERIGEGQRFMTHLQAATDPGAGNKPPPSGGS